MTGPYPEFELRLPHRGPLARGQLLGETGSNGAQKFLLRAGSPARRDAVPSFAAHAPAAHAFRERLISDGVLVESTTWPGLLETTDDVTCGSPSAAAAIVLGRNANGWHDWKSADGHPLADYLATPTWGPNRTWLVRGSNVLRADLVQRLWLPEGVVSLAATRLRTGIDRDVSKDWLRTIVEEDYGTSLSYNQRVRLVDDVHAFLAKMKPGDTVCTISEGDLYVGEITGEAQHLTSNDGRSNLRRPVDWQAVSHTWEDLPEELQQRLSIQDDVVDLTSVAAVVAGLGRSDEELADEAADAGDTSSAQLSVLARQEAVLPEPTAALADELLVHNVAWLAELRELLTDDRQVVLYGPPGTGKTYLALQLAEFFGGGPEQVKLVQFHPSYSYEDFFEGFRPQEDPDTREVSLRITAGPLRELADLADREDNRHLPHFLVIDEINRANLAAVFGELYFLLEYRRKSVRLTYSGDDFALPRNLYIIGTMNTADRSIALVDAAMRRRFAFVELSPRTEPTKGLLRRWLTAEGRDDEPAELLDALNARIDDPDFQVGPSYLMKPGVYRDGGLNRTWRTKILPLLAEHHYGDGVDIERRYGLDALRAALAPPPDTSS